MKLIYYRHNQLKKNTALPPVKTYYTELTLLLYGNMEYVIDGKNVSLQSEDILLCPEGATLSRKSLQNADYYSFNFCFEENDASYDLPLVINNGITKGIKHLLNACDEFYSTTKNINDPFCLIVQCILNHLQDNLRLTRLHPLTLEIMHYISTHLNEPITLSQISDATFFSSSYCSLIFRKDTNSSIIDYVLSEKMKEAKRLIEEGIPLKQIAELLSFTDYNYFSRTFKKKVGCSPISYKQELTKLPNLYQQIPYKQPVTARYFSDSNLQLEQDAENNVPPRQRLIALL